MNAPLPTEKSNRVMAPYIGNGPNLVVSHSAAHRLRCARLFWRIACSYRLIAEKVLARMLEGGLTYGHESITYYTCSSSLVRWRRFLPWRACYRRRRIRSDPVGMYCHLFYGRIAHEKLIPPIKSRSISSNPTGRKVNPKFRLWYSFQCECSLVNPGQLQRLQPEDDRLTSQFQRRL